MRRQREPERVVAVHEHAEHAGAADDGDGAGVDAGMIAGGLERSARRIPQDGDFGLAGSGAIASTVRVRMMRLRRGEFGWSS